MIYEVSVDALAAIANSPRQAGGNPFLPGRSAVALRNLVSQGRPLDFTDDAEVERCIQAIEQVAVDRQAGERDVGEIARTLRQVGVVTRGRREGSWGGETGVRGDQVSSGELVIFAG